MHHKLYKFYQMKLFSVKKDGFWVRLSQQITKREFRLSSPNVVWGWHQ